MKLKALALAALAAVVSMVSPAPARALECDQLTAGLQICLPRYGTDFDQWAQSDINALTLINSSAAVLGSSPTFVQIWVDTITARSARVYVSSYAYFGSSAAFGGHVWLGSSITFQNGQAIGGAVTFTSTTTLAQGLLVSSGSAQIRLTQGAPSAYSAELWLTAGNNGTQRIRGNGAESLSFGGYNAVYIENAKPFVTVDAAGYERGGIWSVNDVDMARFFVGPTYPPYGAATRVFAKDQLELAVGGTISTFTVNGNAVAGNTTFTSSVTVVGDSSFRQAATFLSSITVSGSIGAPVGFVSSMTVYGMIRSTGTSGQPYARWTRTTALNLANDTNTALKLNVKDYDSRADMYAVTTATVPAGGEGVYFIRAFASFANDGSPAGRVNLSVQKNGVVITGCSDVKARVTDDETRVNVSCAPYLVAGDAIVVFGYHNDGSALDVNSAALEIIKLW